MTNKKRTLVSQTDRFKKAYSQGDPSFRNKLSRKTNETVAQYETRVRNLLRSKKEKNILRK